MYNNRPACAGRQWGLKEEGRLGRSAQIWKQGSRGAGLRGEERPDPVETRGRSSEGEKGSHVRSERLAKGRQ